MSSTNIYNSNGSIPSSTNRFVDMNTGSYLLFGKYFTPNYPFIEMWQNGGLQIGYGNNSYHSFGTTNQTISASNSQIILNSSGVSIVANGDDGASGQVLTSNGSTVSWQNNIASDNIYQEGGASSYSWADGADGDVFSGASANGASVLSGTTWAKSSSSAIYRVELVMSTTNATEYPRIALVGAGGGSVIGQMRIYNNLSAPFVNDMSFVFLTNNFTTNLAFRNTTGNSITANIKRIIIQRLR